MCICQNWDLVLPSLVRLYLQWKCEVAAALPPPVTANCPPPVTANPSPPVTADPPPPVSSSAPSPDGSSFQIEVLDIYKLELSATIPYSEAELPIELLIKHGYLGNTPATPSAMVSLRTLELFWCIHLHKSSLSVEVFAKVICDVYSVCTVHIF